MFRFSSVSSARSPAPLSGLAARSSEVDARRVVEILQFDVERLLMITEALWSILKEKHGCEDSDLVQRLEEIDLRDGNLDGRVAPSPPAKCSQCGLMTGKRRQFCLYCGAAVSTEPFAR